MAASSMGLEILRFSSAFIFIFASAVSSSGESNWVWLLAIAAGASSSVQMAVADYLRNAYIYFASGRSRGEFDSSVRLEEEYVRLRRRQTPMRKFLLRVYLDYTVGQERYIPQMTRVREAIESRPPEPWLFERYQRENKPIVKYANFFTEYAHDRSLYPAQIDQPVWYFVFEVTLFNLLLAFVLIRQKIVFDRLLDHLAKATT